MVLIVLTIWMNHHRKININHHKPIFGMNHHPILYVWMNPRLRNAFVPQLPELQIQDDQSDSLVTHRRTGGWTVSGRFPPGKCLGVGVFFSKNDSGRPP